MSLFALHILASGSKGNAAIVEDTSTGMGVLIDCGISGKALIERSEQCGFDPCKLQAVLITHEHTDHISGLGVCLRKLAKSGVNPTVFAQQASIDGSNTLRELASNHDFRTFKATEDNFVLAGMRITPFPTSHDAMGSCGFRFETETDALGFMTDTGIVTGEAHEALRDVRLLGLESNHDPAMLRTCAYPAYVKARIAGDGGHLSNEQSAAELAELLSDKLEHVAALHISQNSNDYRMPGETLRAAVTRASHPANVHVAYQSKPITIR